MKTPHAIVDSPLFQEAFKPYTIKGVLPASGLHPDKLERLKALQQLPLDLSFANTDTSIPYHSSSDALRFEQLKNAVMDAATPSVIWALRGGYGSARLIEALHALPKPTHKKHFIGFSDNTALLLFFSQLWQWPCIHASGLAQMLDLKQDPHNFLKIAEVLAKTVSHLRMEPLKPMNQEAIEASLLEGPLTGGNLTLIQSSIGTLWQIQTDKKILFLEEIGEKGYRIDRSLYHLHQAGLLKNVQAVVLGDFSHPSNQKDIEIALQRFATESPLPIYKCCHFGHGAKNYPLLYNAPSVIRQKKNQDEYELIMSIV